ncbi:YrbL family protein [Malaciobacter marinus]|uniref:YrbL family protein n=1 Tax=Malaciobacter marinus TaxID=505249 RepID=UPI003B00C255
MLKLNEDLLVNKGTNRACYKHPLEHNKCIKIDLIENNETKRELKYYKKLIKDNTSFKMISHYYGSIITNLGKAEVFELIKDYDGSVSKEIDQYMLDSSYSIEDIEEILKNISLLKKYLYENKIYVKDLNPVNVVFQKINTSTNRLVIIDGLAHSNYNPFFIKLIIYY